MTKSAESLKISPFNFKEDNLYDRIADTYFHQKPRHKSRKKKPVISLKNMAVIVKPFLVLCLLIVIGAFASFLADRQTEIVRQRVEKADTINVTSGGAVNREVSKNFSFGGYGRPNSRASKDFIVLNNAKKYNWAELSIDLRFPVNLSERDISLWLKGNSGGERVSLIVRDANNRSARLRDIYAISDWRQEKISMKEAVGNIDLTKIKHIRLEYGYLGESPKDMDSPIGLTVYIKDIKMAKET